MTNVTKEEYWSIILNDPTQIGQITTEDTEFNRRINDVNLVLSNTFINSSDENLISKWETSLYIDGIEGKTLTERKADILYTLCEKNYVPVSIIERFLLNLIGNENKFVVEFIKDENKLVIHTDRISDDMNEAVTSLLESVVLQNVEVVQYNHNMEISWRDINKYATCETWADMYAVDPIKTVFDGKAYFTTDLTSDGDFVYKLTNIRRNIHNDGQPTFFKKVTKSPFVLELPQAGNLDAFFYKGTQTEIHLNAPQCTIGRVMFQSMPNLLKVKVFLPNVTNVYGMFGDSPNVREFEGELPSVNKNTDWGFSDPQFDKPSALRILNSIPPVLSSVKFAIGIHIDHQNDEEVLEAIANAEAKGWTIGVRWNGTSTSTASTMAMGSLIYAKVGEIQLSDGTTEQFLDWVHYVTDETGYETFRSLESAYKYFNLEQPTEF